MLREREKTLSLGVFAQEREQGRANLKCWRIEILFSEEDREGSKGMRKKERERERERERGGEENHL